ncbi:MAG TPA: hypothetical protein VMW27_31185 [Thermoanaerobaculia bacterium]|nr:hypothetical protein [Thermoanaerobaculia bacterium]
MGVISVVREGIEYPTSDGQPMAETTHHQARLTVVRSVAEGRINVGYEVFNYEVAALNLRKSLELIAFGTLSANKEAYAEAHADFAGHWNAKKLFAKLEKLHPEFYPKPVTRQIRDLGPPRQLHFEFVPDGFLQG